MQLTIHTKNKFPHAFAIKSLGGRYTSGGEKYYEDHEEEVSKEYSEIIKSLDARVKHFGNSKKIHSYDDRRITR